MSLRVHDSPYLKLTRIAPQLSDQRLKRLVRKAQAERLAERALADPRQLVARLLAAGAPRARGGPQNSALH